ncbi:MAG: sporulation transcriptional regulator SpoIIID [Clostridia bacterium]|nr:sporulation transcriptional regulator SpoIIID [Clostridia bacterium]
MSVTDWNGKERCVILGEYLLEHQSTVRSAAQVFGISKSTVHKDVTSTLKGVNKSLYYQVQKLLQKNKEERHLRGGEATRLKYSECHKHKEIIGL